MKTLSIIGSSGFIGRSILDYLERTNGSFLKIQKVYLFQRTKLKIKTTKIKSIFKIGDFKKIKKIPETDYIIYAIRSDKLEEAKKIYSNFIKILKKSNKKPKIIFLSSGAVYGKSTRKKKVVEKLPLNKKKIYNLDINKREYALEKIFLEKEFLKLNKKNGFETSIARCFTFYGKFIIKYDYAISQIIKSIKKNKNIILNNRGSTYRSFMHADDLSFWILKIMSKLNKKCPIVNVGSDEEISIKKLARLIIKKFNSNIKIVYNKNAKKCNDYYVPSISCAKNFYKLNISKKINNIIIEDIA